jgi:ribose 5-phosphate isomerase B
LAFAKGFGWGAELNVRYIFEKAFTGEKGLGYPPERRESQVTNAGILESVKVATTKPFLEGLKAIDPELLKTAFGGERFHACFFNNCQDDDIAAFVKSIIA